MSSPAPLDAGSQLAERTDFLLRMVTADYRQQYFAFFTLAEQMEMTLELEEKARRKALAKIRRLRQNDPAATPDADEG